MIDMRLQRVSCRNPHHPARCMRSEPCLFSNPPEFQRACPVPFRVGDARCFSAPVLFRRSPRRSRRDDSSCGAGFAPPPFRRPGSQRLLRVFLLPATVATRLTSTAITGRLRPPTSATVPTGTTWALRLPVLRNRTPPPRPFIPCVVSVACAREQANPLFKNAEL